MSGARALAVLIGVQVALIAVWFGVRALRVQPDPPFLVEVLDEPLPALKARRVEVPVELPSGAYVVHFWATWCAPCQVELPALIEACRATGTPLLAVTDEPWPVVERYFEGRVPGEIVRDADAAAAWRVSGLPDTFVVQGGRVAARVGGPREWAGREARSFLASGALR